MQGKTPSESLWQTLQPAAILVVFLLVFFSLHLVKVAIGVGILALSVLVFLLLVTPFVFLGVKSFRKMLRAKLAEKPFLLLVWAVGIGLAIAVYGWITGQIGGLGTLVYIVYAAVPAALFIQFPQSPEKPNGVDALVLLWLWLPIQFGWLPTVAVPMIDAFLRAEFVLAALLLLAGYSLLRRMRIGLVFKMSMREWAQMFLYYFILLILGIVLGRLLGLLTVDRNISNAQEILLQLAAIGFFVALPQELFFRGIIYNLLVKRLQPIRYNVLYAILISSLLFGLAHGGLSIGPTINISLGALQWACPWALILMNTFAGFFYVWIYIRIGKIAAPVLLHTLVNWTWFAFLTTA